MQNYFENKTRDNGESFYCLTDNAPDELRDLIRELHGDRLPNDWVYTTAYHLFLDIDSNTDEDELFELADNLVDNSYSVLLLWLADWHAYVDDSVATNVFNMIQSAQQTMIMNMAQQVLEYVQELEVE